MLTTGSFSDRLRSVPLPPDLSASLTWDVGDPVPYAALVATFEEVAQKPGRLDKESALKRFFVQVLGTSPQHLEAAVYLSFNQVLPVYEGLELGVGDSLLVKAIGEATGRKKDAIEEDYEREGDLGLVSLLSRQAQKTLIFLAKPRPLTVSEVLEALRAICRIKGEKAVARKVEAIKGLLVRCQGMEAKYLIRLVTISNAVCFIT